jgi:outer membrane protein assembly factor BamB
MNNILIRWAFTVFLLAPLMSCKKSEPTAAELPVDTNVVLVDTNWIYHTQVDVPWPGLANSPWPMFLHDPQHTGRSPYRGPQEGKVDWLFDAGFTVYSSPAIDLDGSIYFGTLLYNYFYSITPSGSQKWRSLGGGGEGSPLIASDGSIYIIGGSALQPKTALLSYDRNGNINWEYVVGQSSYSAPVISRDGEIVYLAATYLYAIRRNGTLYWQQRPSDSADGGYLYSPAMSPDGSTLYVPGFKALYAVDTSGTLKWKFGGDAPSNPAVDNDGNVYFGESWGHLYSLNPSGTIRWMRSDIDWGPMDPGPVIGRDGTIYITGRALYAVDYAGKLKWKFRFPNLNSQCVPAIDSAGTIYVGRSTYRTVADSINFLAVNANGTLKFELSMRSPDGSVPDIDSKPAIGADGRIYVGSDRPRGFHVYKIK